MSERTKLHRFMEANGITEPELVRESGLSARQLSNVKLGKSGVTQGSIGKLLMACRRLRPSLSIEVTDLFDFAPPRREKRASSR
jgi:transcriptional regulator with XRE-family HTH domain